MTGHHFVSTWQVQAPIERVWEELYRAERWPSLVKAGGSGGGAGTECCRRCWHAPAPAPGQLSAD